MDYKQSKKKPGREEFKEDMAEAVEKGTRKAKGKKKWQKMQKLGKQGVKVVKKKAKKVGKKALAKYGDMSAKEMYQLVKGKRDLILSKKGIPPKLPRGKKALIDICAKIKA